MVAEPSCSSNLLTSELAKGTAEAVPFGGARHRSTTAWRDIQSKDADLNWTPLQGQVFSVCRSAEARHRDRTICTVALDDLRAELDVRHIKTTAEQALGLVEEIGKRLKLPAEAGDLAGANKRVHRPGAAGSLVDIPRSAHVAECDVGVLQRASRAIARVAQPDHHLRRGIAARVARTGKEDIVR